MYKKIYYNYMQCITILFITLSFISSCQGHKNVAEKPGVISETYNQDTMVIGSSTVREVKMKKAKEYFLLINSKRSSLICTITESEKTEFKEDGDVSLEISLAKDKTYRQQLAEIRKILQYASTEFNFDSLKLIHNFFLFNAGDLTIDLSNQLNANPLKFDVSDNYIVAKFLLNSRLSSDLNSLFKPYGLVVKRYEIEHPKWTDVNEFLSNNTIEANRKNIPTKVLDGNIWIYLGSP